MITIECSGCRYDLNSGDGCYCEDCYTKLQDRIEELEDTINKLESDVEGYEKTISELEREAKNANTQSK